MYNVCPNCGLYNAEKIIDPEGPFAICPECNYAQPFLQLPLFVLTGASGTGKTTICLNLVNKVAEYVVLDTDILWRPEFNKPEDNYREYRELWLRLAKNIGQNGRPVLLCGTAVPEGFESCIERRYFSKIHYLGLVCDPDILTSRLTNRPLWRKAYDPSWISSMISFNGWLLKNAGGTTPPIALFDTSHHSIEETTVAVDQWVKEALILHENSTGIR